MGGREILGEKEEGDKSEITVNVFATLFSIDLFTKKKNIYSVKDDVLFPYYTHGEGLGQANTVYITTVLSLCTNNKNTL